MDKMINKILVLFSESNLDLEIEIKNKNKKVTLIIFGEKETFFIFDKELLYKFLKNDLKIYKEAKKWYEKEKGYYI